MAETFKRGNVVLYRTPRGGQEGLGKIVEIHRTGRGPWFEVKDQNTGARLKLRASSMELA